MKRFLGFVMFVSLVVFSTGCDDSPTSAVTDADGNLVLAFSGLESLGSGFLYEGWIIVGGAPVSTGTFSIDAGGELDQTDFEVDDAALEAAVKFVLTIEPSPDPDPSPSATHVLAGDFFGSTAGLSVGDPAALAASFGAAAGPYILETPSTAAAADYASGIWWLNPAGPTASLRLPLLPDGWMYEGWVVGSSGPISTGRFLSPLGTDSDGAGPTAGPSPGPPFPGQDYISPNLNLIGYAAVISIEPEPDDSDAPFAFKPLVDSNIDDLGAGVLQTMANMSAGLPTGSAVRN